MSNEQLDLHAKYGLTRIVNACGKMTHLGGAIVLPEIRPQVSSSLGHFFDLDEIQERAGETIAKAFGAEWGCVTACTGAGIALSVAASMTGNDAGRVAQLPDTTGMKNRVVIQKGHAVNFGAPVTQMCRLAGAQVVEIGTVNGAKESHLTHAIDDDTAAVVFVVSHHTTRFGCIPLSRVVELAHAKGVPVIVDAAAQSFVMPKILATGADIAICSGHKFLCGTTAGVVAGRRDLVDAVYLQNRGIGRPMKVGKEGIFGVLASLEVRMATDTDQWKSQQDSKRDRIHDRLRGIDGVGLDVEDDPNGNPFSRAQISIDPDGANISAAVVAAVLEAGRPSIRVRAHHVDEGWFTIDANELTDDDVELVCDRLVDVLTTSDADKDKLMKTHGGERAMSPEFSWLS
jgi:L-seryl-tRNA(Ser) seleniumtransferase